MTYLASVRVQSTAYLLLALLMIIPLSHSFGQDAGRAADHAKALSVAFRQAAQQTSPSVVTILAKTRIALGRGRADLRELLRDPRFRELLPEGLDIPDEDERDDEADPRDGFANHVGSGVIIDGDGLILTNNHVVEGADEVTVRLSDGREFEAFDIQRDRLSDVATLKIKDAGMLRAAKLGDSSKLEIGDWVIAIGSPFELEATVSAGIISGKGRGIHQIVRGTLLQTDAAINPGNSGGPLVNLDGEVVGINTAIASNSGGYQGIGFAIPIDRAKWVSKELLEFGKVRRAFLGVQIDDLSAEAGKELGRPARSGVLVVDAIPSGPAAKAGIRAHDIIVEFAGRPTRRVRELMDEVEQKPLDSKQEVKVFRDGKMMTFQVTVTALESIRETANDNEE
jgi:serine protease Do